MEYVLGDHSVLVHHLSCTCNWEGIFSKECAECPGPCLFKGGFLLSPALDHLVTGADCCLQHDHRYRRGKRTLHARLLQARSTGIWASSTFPEPKAARFSSSLSAACLGFHLPL